MGLSIKSMNFLSIDFKFTPLHVAISITFLWSRIFPDIEFAQENRELSGLSV